MIGAEEYLKANAIPREEPAEKVSISLPRNYIRLADQAAKNAGLSRSEVVKLALKRLFEDELVEAA